MISVSYLKELSGFLYIRIWPDYPYSFDLYLRYPCVIVTKGGPIRPQNKYLSSGKIITSPLILKRWSDTTYLKGLKAIDLPWIAVIPNLRVFINAVLEDGKSHNVETKQLPRFAVCYKTMKYIKDILKILCFDE